MDCDVPPPLDDKLRENDFDLDEEEIIIEDNRNSELELPELPTDFNVFSSVATDEHVSYSHSPPVLEFESSPPSDDHRMVDECNKSDSPVTCDVAKEKESFSDNDVVSQRDVEQIKRNEKESNDLSIGENTVITCAQVSTVKPGTNDDDSSSTAVLEAINSVNDDISPNSDVKSRRDIKSNAIVDQSATADDDDDFQEFVEADPIDETPETIKTEEPDVELDDLKEFTAHDDIPEPIPELRLDEDDDFNDFETAIPANRIVQVTDLEPPANMAFEADFSAFDAFSATTECSFNEHPASGLAEAPTLNSQFNDDNEDDDFGDFNDFTQASPSAPSNSQPVALVKPANVNGILDMMFPSSSCSSEKLDDCASDQTVIKGDNFVSKFNDFDSTLALGYHYSNSKASQTLVKALGIDTRNIVSRFFTSLNTI